MATNNISEDKDEGVLDLETERNKRLDPNNPNKLDVFSIANARKEKEKKQRKKDNRNVIHWYRLKGK